MPNSNRIPVKNIYYMLCYAWERLKEKDLASIGQEDEKDIYHLLARILIKRLQALVKKGFYREYQPFVEEMSTLSGRIDFKDSLRNFSFKRGKMVCHVDEFSHDILHNQIIKTTLYHLLTNNQLDQKLKDEIRPLYLWFGDISIIKLQSKMFNEVRIHKSNQHYGFILDICKLLFDCLLLNEEQSTTGFVDFEREHMAMAKLFEHFVRHFYRKETDEFKVSSEIIYWDTDSEDTSLLPKMQTDVSLESKEIKIILDTKYYHSAFSKNYGQEKLKSANLYQLFAYLVNNEKKGEKDLHARGILLYPKVQKDLDATYEIKGHKVKVCTVDLSKSWMSIHERLMEVIVF